MNADKSKALIEKKNAILKFGETTIRLIDIINGTTIETPKLCEIAIYLGIQKTAVAAINSDGVNIDKIRSKESKKYVSASTWYNVVISELEKRQTLILEDENKIESQKLEDDLKIIERQKFESMSSEQKIAWLEKQETDIKAKLSKVKSVNDESADLEY